MERFGTMPQRSYQIKDLLKTYPGFKLRIKELSLYKGEIFCLLGASGAGKTTLLRLQIFWKHLMREVVFEGHSFSAVQNHCPWDC